LNPKATKPPQSERGARSVVGRKKKIWSLSRICFPFPRKKILFSPTANSIRQPGDENVVVRQM